MSDPSLSDETVFVTDPFNLDMLLGAVARNSLDSHHVDCVMSEEEYGVANAAVLAELCGWRGPTWRTVISSRDKAYQKSRMRAAGLPVADWTVIDDLLDPNVIERAGELQYPLVLKPVGGAGTEATAKVTSATELASVIERLRPGATGRRTYIAESFVDMREEWHVEGVVQEGEVVFACVGEYERPCLEVANGHVVRSRFLDEASSPEHYRTARPLLERVVEALGIRNSVVHLELFITADGVVTGECASRMGGGVTPEAVMAKTGLDLSKASLQVATGIPFTPPDREPAAPEVAMTILRTHPGTVVETPSAGDIMRREEVDFALVVEGPGTVVQSTPTSAIDRIAEAVVIGPTPEELWQNVAQVESWFADASVVQQHEAQPVA